MDQLFQKARRELDPAKRNVLYAEIDRQIYEDQPMTIFLYPPTLWAFSKSLRATGTRRAASTAPARASSRCGRRRSPPRAPDAAIRRPATRPGSPDAPLLISFVVFGLIRAMPGDAADYARAGPDEERGIQASRERYEEMAAGLRPPHRHWTIAYLEWAGKFIGGTSVAPSTGTCP